MAKAQLVKTLIKHSIPSNDLLKIMAYIDSVECPKQGVINYLKKTFGACDPPEEPNCTACMSATLIKLL